MFSGGFPILFDVCDDDLPDGAACRGLRVYAPVGVDDLGPVAAVESLDGFAVAEDEEDAACV